MSQGDIQLSAFFDLKEDGNLDILVEYAYEKRSKLDFIKCDDKGDTTFLKLQIFTNVCTNQCPDVGTIKKESDIGNNDFFDVINFFHF